MEQTKNFTEIKKSQKNLQVMVVLDSLYSKNDHSPVSKNKSSSQSYLELANVLGDILHNRLQNISAENARDFPFTRLFSLAEMILLSISKSPTIFLEVMNPEYSGDFLTCHSLNVAFLSCKAGSAMDLSYKDLTRLGVAGLLHDIGMTKIDADCYHHKRDLSKYERMKMENHPNLGWQFFQKLEGEFPWLLRVILEEHKRENNQGYPAELKGDLHPFSKIIGVCDSFEALSHKRIFRKAFHPADVMKTIIEAKEFLFAKSILRAVIESLSMYPVGSLVQLNNKKIAQVIEAVEGAPLRPKIKIISQIEGELSDDVDTINLSKDNNLYITGLVYNDHYQVPENISVS